MDRLIDLSMPIDTHFRWKIERRQSGDLLQGDNFQITHVCWSVHAFTHIDSPRHILADGTTTDDISLKQVVGDCAVLDLTDIGADAPIEEEQIAKAGQHIQQGDIVLLKTAWDRSFSPHSPEFWTKSPYMTRQAAEWLLRKKVRSVAFDFPQDYPIRLTLKGEYAHLSEFVTHDVLLRNGVILMEYLCNTKELTQARVFLCALPLKIPNADGAPARVIAKEIV
ncbi:hypothetical protein CSB45_14145 [candidate division KSB3 bacterium]|uniref:Cyclase n=1 Tax=candidate division KSB3 bacterium TaxID=2044937 RepID=A0A2G6E1L4_9BACT|nr:MAG: hypothetical protein CSB45_14145 [candidate division KSB3 bacterium]PIE28467.1 MAG: hypothetical protein CSA57_13790 [candidate division KSB3 bacterium]